MIHARLGWSAERLPGESTGLGDSVTAESAGMSVFFTVCTTSEAEGMEVVSVR